MKLKKINIKHHYYKIEYKETRLQQKIFEIDDVKETT